MKSTDITLTVEFHVCESAPVVGGWEHFAEERGFEGPAINVIYQTPEGSWVATTQRFERGSYIRFCPFCGERLGE